MPLPSADPPPHGPPHSRLNPLSGEESRQSQKRIKKQTRRVPARGAVIEELVARGKAASEVSRAPA